MAARQEKHDFFAAGTVRMAASDMRQNNERAVLTAIVTEPGSSGAQIARRTGLGAQSISRILGDLETMGLLVRGEPRRGQRGQPAIPIHLNPNGAYCVGCEIGWRHVDLVLRNLAGEVLAEHRREYAFPDATTIFSEVASLVRLLIGHIPEASRSRLVGIGLAMPGSFSRNLGLVGGSARQAEAWKDVDAGTRLSEVSGLPVWVFNDGNAGCWAELTTHPAPRPNNMAYFHVGTFIGAGIIAEGRLWEGPTGNSANLGSIIVADSQGRNKFVHLVSSLHALENRLREAGVPVPTGDPELWDWASLEPHLSDWITESSAALAKAVANTAAVIEFSVAVIGGAMPKNVLERLIEGIRHESDDLPVLTADHPTIEAGRLGGGAAARGAASKVLYRRYFSREARHLSEV